MSIKINTATFFGIKGELVSVEVDIRRGLPSFNIVGMGDIAVKESRERVRSAILNSGFTFPISKITVNLAPADIRKVGSHFDLPIAIGILEASHQLYGKGLNSYMFVGELSLSGELKKVRGSLPILSEGLDKGINNFIVPQENAKECSLLKDAIIYPFNNLLKVTSFLRYKDMLPYQAASDQIEEECFSIDYSEVIGQDSCKRALEVAAAGNHCALLFGPPGSGKTMLAKRLPTILPDLSYYEALEVTKIYSVANRVSMPYDVKNRPFRMPHHSCSVSALAGGGVNLIPGEVSLAHNGVLYLDELLEFKRGVLEILRQPLEEKFITITKMNKSITYPANIMMLGSLNPCPCGYYNSGIRSCSCSEAERRRYVAKLSGPLLDRIDLFSFVGSVPYKEIKKKPAETSMEIKKRVQNARTIQLERYVKDGITSNSQMSQKHIKRYCQLDRETEELMEAVYKEFHLSLRAYDKLLKVSRTLADLSERDHINKEDVVEAIQYRRFIDERII
ncbi:MAG TPA: YifB family Mg chelatase-like AAA ATPase [Clostridiaceae bacterium]